MSCVYFVQGGPDGPIKIGVTTDFPTRIAAIRSLSPSDINVLAVVHGGAAFEREVHAKLSHHRLHGEWFAPHDEVLKFVAEVQSGVRSAEAATPRTPDEQSLERRKEILAISNAFIAGIAHPIPMDESKPETIKRVADMTGVSARKIRALIYSEPGEISAFDYLSLRKAFVIKFAKRD